MTTFAELGLTQPLIDALAKQDITVPTDIQAAAIPALREGRDVIGQAHTAAARRWPTSARSFSSSTPAAARCGAGCSRPRTN